MNLKKAIAIISIMVMAFIVTGCGGDSGSNGYSVGKDFTLGENTFALEKVENNAEKNTDSTQAYEVSVLIEGSEAPVIMSPTIPTPQSAVRMDLVKADGSKISATGINFTGIEDQGKYGVRMTFNFDVPNDEDFPATAIMTNTSNEEETVTLDLTSALAG